jgi:integrase
LGQVYLVMRRITKRTLIPLRQSCRLAKSRPDRTWAVYYPDSINGYQNNYGRRFFRHKADAEAFCSVKRSELANLGALADSLTDSLKREALHCAELLKPIGRSLTEAVTWYLKEYKDSQASVSVSIASQAIVQRLRADGYSKRHCNSLSNILAIFGRSYSDQIVSSITSDNVQKWLDDYRTKENRPLGAVSFNSYRRYLSLFFSFCIKKGWLATNPVSKISQQRVITKVPRLLTPSDLKLILEAVSGDLKIAIALQALCGLRSSEVARVCWTDVLFNESGNYIQIGADTAKTSRRRLTPIPDNLIALLRSYRKPDGFIYAAGKGKLDAIQRALVAIRKTLNTIQWGRNALRASALSYRLAQTKDASATALEMGNSPAVLMRDYRELTTHAQALEWFGMTIK